MIFPLRPDGLKLFADTPIPDHVPVMPLCVVGNAIEEAVWQMEAGMPVMAGVTGTFTVIEVDTIFAHWDAI